MHYLVVAKVKDYPDADELVLGLTRQTDILGSPDFQRGKWESIKDEFQDYWENSYLYSKMALSLLKEMFADYGKDLSLLNEKYSKTELTQRQRQFTKDHGFWSEEQDIYAKVSGHFDYLIQGGKYDMKNKKKTVKYKDVVAKFGKVDVFVLPDFECRFTKHRDVECPYQDDDEVWVLDGYTYCSW